MSDDPTLTDEELAAMERRLPAHLAGWFVYQDMPRLIAALRASRAEVERLSDELNRCHYTLSMAGVDLGDYGEPSE